MYTETNQANKYGPVPAGRQRNSLEHGSSIFRPEIVQTFSDDFRPVPVGTHRKLTGIHQKKIRTISGWNTASSSMEFQRFPAGFGDRNLRLGKFNDNETLNIIGFEQLVERSLYSDCYSQGNDYVF